MKIRVRHPAIGEAIFLLGEHSAVTIGRKGNTASCEFGWDPRISESHARMWMEDGEVWFEDLGSRSGSYLGDRRIQGRLTLARGDSVRLGDTWLMVPDELDEWAENDQRLWTPSEVATGDIQSEWVEDRPRRHERYTTRQPVVVRILPDGVPRAAVIRDVSVGGVFLEAKVPPPLGTELLIAIDTERGTLRLHGEVVHIVDDTRSRLYTIPTGIGIRLDGLTGVVHTEWMRFLKNIGVPVRGRTPPPAVVWSEPQTFFEEPESEVENAPWWRTIFTPAWERAL